MIDREFLNGYFKGIFRPGAVLVTHGMRGGGKTHSAIAFCQNLIEHRYPDCPKYVILITNVIFVKKVDKTQHPEGFVKEAPENVFMVERMRDIFPIITDALERYGRKDLLVIFLLDEAQNFLMGDENSRGEMAVSMKKFCGIIRKFNLCLWLISPRMMNLGPAFRNFLDADTDSGNVTCTFQKIKTKAEGFVAKMHLDIDPRSIAFVKAGFTEPVQYIPVPDSSWTRVPETLALGEYAYDTYASADFDIGDFPFREFVRHISGKSSYDMIPAVKEFYATLGEEEKAAPTVDGRMTREEWIGLMFPVLKKAGLNQTNACKAFRMDHRRLKRLVEQMGGRFDDEGGGDVQDSEEDEAAGP